MSESNNTVPLETISKLLDLTPRRVNQLTKDGVLPKVDRGRYALVPVVRSYIRYLRERSVNTDVGADDYAAHRARLTKARADMAEMEREQMANNLIPSDDVADAWEVMAGNMRSRLLAIPSKTAATIFSADDVVDAKKILKDTINEALAELSSIEVKTANPIRSAELDDDSEEDAKPVSTTTRAKNK